MALSEPDDLKSEKTGAKWFGHGDSCVSEVSISHIVSSSTKGTQNRPI